MTYYSALHYAAKAEAAATTATTLLPYLTDITTVATNIASVNTVSTNIAIISAVDNSLTDITTAATNIASINTVAGDINRVNLVADDISSVHTVAVDISTVIDVDNNMADINAVAGDLTNINAVAADLTNIDNASTYAAEAKQWAIGDPSEPVDGSAKYWAQQAAGQVIPSQTGHSGEFLTTDGTALSWDNVDALPDQTGQAGKYLTTDGTDASWDTLIIPSVDVDGISINRNTSNALQSIGVIDKNNPANALGVWHGTQAEYDALATHDANTRYYTDGGLSVSLLNVLYPVGSIYITTNSSCPLSTLIAGSTWVLVGQDRVLQGAGTRGAVGTTLNESLPNITGDTGLVENIPNISYTGAISKGTAVSPNGVWNESQAGATYGLYRNRLDASGSSSTYQDNAPVQPDAYLVNIYRRIS